MDTITHGIVGALIGKAFFAGHGDATRADGTAAQRAAGQFAGLGSPPQAPRWNRGECVATAAATLGAVFPDVDVIFGPIVRNDLAVIELHRSITHSLLCLPVFAVVLAALTRWYARRRALESPSWVTLSGIYGVALASHILLDLVTSFGTMIWSPWKRARPAWDLVFIIDFTLTAIVLLPQLVAWVYRQRERSFRRAAPLWAVFSGAAALIAWGTRAAGFTFSSRAVVAVSALLAAWFFLPAWGSWGFSVPRASWCRAGVYALAAYLCLCAMAHQAALRRVEQFAAARGLRVVRLGALPLPPFLAYWDGLIRTPEGVYEARFDLSRGYQRGLAPDSASKASNGEFPTFHFFADSPPNGYLEAARQLPRVKTYLWFARFPVFRYTQSPDPGPVPAKSGEAGSLHIIEIRDLRFFQRGRGPAPFTFRVTFDAAGHVVEQGWAPD